MNCPRCKTPVTSQDKYCPSCGLPLEAARAAGPGKKPTIKKAYEEASTQLVDVDAFRKFIAEEKAASKGEKRESTESLSSPAAPPAAKQMPVSNLAAMGGGTKAEPDASPPSSASGDALSGDFEVVQPRSRKMILGGLVLLVCILALFLVLTFL